MESKKGDDNGRVREREREDKRHARDAASIDFGFL